MQFKFVSDVPPRGGTFNKMDMDFAQEVIEALLDNPNEWAQIPYLLFYPTAQGTEVRKLTMRARNFSERIRKGAEPFNDYVFECTTRGTDMYIRVLVNERDVKDF